MGWLLLSDALSTWGYSQVAALLNIHLVDQGFSPQLLGSAYAISLVMGSMLAMPAGLAADLWSCRHALLMGSLAMVLAVWGQLTATGPLKLWLAFALVGIATALFTAAKAPQIGLLVKPAQFPSALAFCRGMASLAALLGGWAAAGLCWRYSSYGLALWVGAGLVGIAWIPLLALPHERHHVRMLTYHLRRPVHFSLNLLSFASFTLAVSMIFPFINLLLSQRGFSPGAVAFSHGCFQLAGLLAWPLAALTGEIPVLLPAMLLGSAAMTGWMWAAPQPGLWWALLFAWHILTAVAMSSYYVEFYRRVAASGVAFAAMGLIYSATAALGAWLGGELMACSYDTLLIVSAGCLAMALLTLPTQTARGSKIQTY